MLNGDLFKVRLNVAGTSPVTVPSGGTIPILVICMCVCFFFVARLTDVQDRDKKVFQPKLHRSARGSLVAGETGSYCVRALEGGGD